MPAQPPEEGKPLWQRLAMTAVAVMGMLILFMLAASALHPNRGVEGVASNLSLNRSGSRSSREGAFLRASANQISSAGVALRSQSGSAGSSKFAKSNHLVMVATHAVLQDDHCGEDWLTDKAWVLLDYQRNQGGIVYEVQCRTCLMLLYSITLFLVCFVRV